MLDKADSTKLVYKTLPDEYNLLYDSHCTIYTAQSILYSVHYTEYMLGSWHALGTWWCATQTGTNSVEGWCTLDNVIFVFKPDI